MTETTNPNLVALDGYAMPVLASAGSQERARVIAARTGRALSWLERSLRRRPLFTLYVLDEQDWPAVSDVPIYGMPQSVPGKIVTSPQPAGWWQEYLDALRPHLPPEMLADLARVFGDPADFTTMADLVAVHELTHLFHEIHPVTWASEFPADWVMELFANIGMHGYVATHEPQLLPLPVTLAAAARAAGAQPWPLRELAAMGASMQTSVPNYVWFEFMLIGFAESIWNTGGIDAMLAFQQTLGQPTLSPEAVVHRLTAIDPAVAEAVRAWPTG
ncbi:hypothetical protein [Alloactinosynnema sp. L-07]|uniref:hypothetical protein n=1 Tax=Alloactinosynnema sp. L-07 TaxID=1653480 RepID=UPI00065F0546|nr:hypothetical protein [Alloactinosynnema sp. L-07]CRK57626.1 hypothetical protein [Alloactinosynnema sp. L-07]